jgi:hypothetical protein
MKRLYRLTKIGRDERYRDGEELKKCLELGQLLQERITELRPSWSTLANPVKLFKSAQFLKSFNKKNQEWKKEGVSVVSVVCPLCPLCLCCRVESSVV